MLGAISMLYYINYYVHIKLTCLVLARARSFQTITILGREKKKPPRSRCGGVLWTQPSM